MAEHKTASEMMENPDVCPFCEADAMDVDVNNDDEGYCCKCQRSWKLERRFVGYSYTDEEGRYHEVTQEHHDDTGEISRLTGENRALEEQVRTLREALAGITRRMSEDDSLPEEECECGRPAHLCITADGSDWHDDRGSADHV